MNRYDLALGKKPPEKPIEKINRPFKKAKKEYYKDVRNILSVPEFSMAAILNPENIQPLRDLAGQCFIIASRIFPSFDGCETPEQIETSAMLLHLNESAIQKITKRIELENGSV